MIRLYRLLTYCVRPIIPLFLNYRLKRGKENQESLQQRRGIYSVPKNSGELVWIHCVSIGECFSAVALIAKLRQEGHRVLLTSSSVTALSLMRDRLPEDVIHQFLPLDYPTYVKRFFDWFSPDVALFVESDFWPNILSEAKVRGIPIILVNGRVSDNSFRRWSHFHFAIRAILRMFTLAFAQTEADAEKLRILGAKRVLYEGNLKFASKPRTIEPQAAAELQRQIGGRDMWCAISTHSDEERQIALVHKTLKAAHPNLLTIIIPRHPSRAEAIESAITQMGLRLARRSRGEQITPQCDIYLADTLGEVELFASAAKINFVGGSLIERGGQNVLEPMRLGIATLTGPHTFNFREIISRAKEADAIIEVASAAELGTTVDKLLGDKERRESLGQRAAVFANRETTVLDRVYSQINKFLK